MGHVYKEVFFDAQKIGAHTYPFMHLIISFTCTNLSIKCTFIQCQHANYWLSWSDIYWRIFIIGDVGARSYTVILRAQFEFAKMTPKISFDLYTEKNVVWKLLKDNKQSPQ